MESNHHSMAERWQRPELGQSCGSAVDVGVGEWVTMDEISSLRGMKESLVTIISLT